MICTHCDEAEATHFIKCPRTIYAECEGCYEFYKVQNQIELTADEITIYLTAEALDVR